MTGPRPPRPGVPLNSLPSGAPSPAPEPDPRFAWDVAEAYLRPFLSLLDRLSDGSPQTARVRVDALRALMLEHDRLRIKLKSTREQAEGAEWCWHQAEDYARAYIDAFEQLHGRVVGTCDLDAAEAPPPAEAYWADQIEQLLHTARELAEDLDPMDDSQAKAAPHLVTVTRLDVGFDPSDTRRFEYIVGNDVTGRISHLVTHSAACHLLPYGQQCWLDDEWERGQFSFADIAPGRYIVTLHRQAIDGGETSGTEESPEYQRLNTSPARES